METNYKMKYIEYKKLYAKYKNFDYDPTMESELTDDEYKTKYYKYKYKLAQCLTNDLSGGRMGVYEPPVKAPKENKTKSICNIL